MNERDAEAEPAGVESPAFGSTVTILFSDIRGFTEYTDLHGDEAAYRMLRHHNTLVQEQLALFRGHVVKTQGDSYMVSFDSARTAVTCAVAIQKAIGESNRRQEGAGIDIGIGINTGEPVREGSDFFGGTVNLASRICAAARSGQVLVSETVRAVTGKMEGVAFSDQGDFQLKGFREPQRLYEVIDAPFEPEAAGPAMPAATGAEAPAADRAPVTKDPAPAIAALPVATPGRTGRPRWLVPAAAAMVVLIIIGSAGYLILHRSAGSGTTALHKGKLLYQAQASSSAWSVGSPPSPDPDGSASVTYVGSSIHLNVLQQGGSLGGELNAPALKNYVAELVVGADAGTDLEINWSLRASDNADLSLHIDLPSESMRVVYEPYTGDSVDIIKDVPLSGIQSGKRFTIDLVADGSHLELYRDGLRVGQAEEAGANGGTTPGFYLDGNGGSFHLDAVRYYAIP